MKKLLYVVIATFVATGIFSSPATAATDDKSLRAVQAWVDHQQAQLNATDATQAALAEHLGASAPSAPRSLQRSMWPGFALALGFAALTGTALFYQRKRSMRAVGLARRRGALTLIQGGQRAD